MTFIHFWSEKLEKSQLVTHAPTRPHIYANSPLADITLNSTEYRVFRNCLRTLPAIFDIENVDEYSQKIKSFYEEGCDNFLSHSKFESRTSVKSQSTDNSYIVFIRVSMFFEKQIFWCSLWVILQNSRTYEKTGKEVVCSFL